MTREDIIRMAQEAEFQVIGQRVLSPVIEGSDLAWLLERFAALVAAAERKRLEATAWGASKKWIVEAVAAEREACAALLDANAMACENPIYRSLLQANAAAIRDRDPSNMPLFDDWPGGWRK